MPSTRQHAACQALQRRITRLAVRLQRLEALSRRYTRIRISIVVAGLGAIFLAGRVGGNGLGWVAIVLTVVTFVTVAIYHQRVERSLRRHRIWRRLKLTQIARMTRDWEHIPATPDSVAEAEHPFAADLNVLGTHSLYRLLDTTMSQGGGQRLRTWLCQPVLDAAHIRARQAFVRELRPLGRFRDRLALHGTLVTRHPEQRWEGARLQAWLTHHAPHAALARWAAGLSALAGLNIGLGLLYAAGLLPAFWFFSWLVYAVLYLAKHGETATLFTEAFHLEGALRHLRAVLEYLETYRYHRTPLLAQLCTPFTAASRRPSVLLKRIIRIAGAASVQRGNLLGVLINATVPWDLVVAHYFNRYKEDVRTVLPVWLDTWYELEALNALAEFSAANPDDVFPEVVSPDAEAQHPVVWAQHLGHPLLPDATRVCNDVTLPHLGAVALITGSNMSGKSTFLRTVGLNLCLAYAGAPVHATAMRTSVLRVFTCMNVSDSVTDGISYFYAEVRRLKALLQALQQDNVPPLCFLIDEIFRGTNNRERLLGAHAYMQALTGSHGVGMVSTHDLDLVGLLEAVPGIDNYHFREEVIADRMVFDYRLRPGPCPTTNALMIMHMAGLPVPVQASRA